MSDTAIFGFGGLALAFAAAVVWLQGTADLRLTCVNSVAVVGAPAATGYGNHVAVEMAAVLAEHGLESCPAARYETHQARTADRSHQRESGGARGGKPC
jgi:hypothetical protein